MIVAVSIGVVTKKALQALMSNKKGRNFIAYGVGIVVVIVLLPVIMLYGLFGWMAGETDNVLQGNQWVQNLPEEQQELLMSLDGVYNNISSVFIENGLEKSDIKKANSIYISKLMGLESNTDFYINYANCFKGVAEDKSVYKLIEETFYIVFSDEDILQFDALYGETPIRGFEEISKEDNTENGDTAEAPEPES